MKQSKMFIVVVVLLISIVNVYAQDWPQYLGPNRNGKSDQKGILRSWPQKGPEVLWTVDVGIGFGGPVVKERIHSLRFYITAIFMLNIQPTKGKTAWFV